MEAFVGKILPSLLIIVLMAFSAEAERVSMEKNESGSSGRTLSSKNNTRDDCNQDGTEIRRMIQNPNNRPCYAQFFVSRRQPEGLRTGQALQTVKYICQPPAQNQQVQQAQQTYYATMFDERYGIAVFSAYKLTPANAHFPGNQDYGVIQWTQTPGIQRQGSDALYGNRKYVVRGHLAPANIFSNNAQRYASTFTYTNAVPQKYKFNNGQWKAFEGRIRGYIRRCMEGDLGQQQGQQQQQQQQQGQQQQQQGQQGQQQQGQQGQQQGQQGQQQHGLYLLTGTSFAHTQQGQNLELKWIPRNKPLTRISIPYSLWTAGCCINPPGQHTESFAVIGNNEQPIQNQLTQQISVAQLQNILAADVRQRGIGGQNVVLFPGDLNCGLRNTQLDLNHPLH